ncbi:MAG: site-specific integrase [Acidimicrobiia bacterium]|nr:site-specific integrase [Acidimicrobiia bacterium]
MRRGEVFGIRWGDVDLDEGRVTVRRQLRTVRHVPELVEVTKSSAGRRTIDLDDETVAVLRSHRAAQGREKLALGGSYDDADRVFAGIDGSEVHPASAAKVFERRVARSGLPRIRFHDLRHTHAVHLIAAGVREGRLGAARSQLDDVHDGPVRALDAEHSGWGGVGGGRDGGPVAR